jgi:outer membrane protein
MFLAAPFIPWAHATQPPSTNGPLTLEAVQAQVVARHPLLTAAGLKAMAAHQATLQVRANQLPSLTANLTAVGTADDNTRLAAINAINNPIIFDRAAAGVSLSQLITDFGRSGNLLDSARDNERAQNAATRAVRGKLLLATSSAFFAVQQSQAILQVARETVQARKTQLEQVTALARNQLRSDLDVSFAQVGLEESRLLEARAENDRRAACLVLGGLLGITESTNFHLAEVAIPAPPPSDLSPWIAAALQNHPEILRLRAELSSQQKLAKSHQAARWPTVSLIGSAGVVPWREDRLEDSFAAGGFVLNLPLLAGGRDVARQKEAELKAKATEATLADETEHLVRQIELTALKVQHAQDRRRMTERLIEHARTAADLAEARYRVGSSSITELGQAQLNLTTARLAEASARYEYLSLHAALTTLTPGRP